VVYPGSIERVDFGEANEEKGFCIVSLEKGNTQYEFVPTPARKFVKIELDVREQVDPTATILQKLKDVDVTDAVVRLSYVADEEQRGLVDEGLVRDTLHEAFLVVGITQVTETTRRQRPRIASGLSTIDTLERYLDFTPELQEMKEDLRTYAERLIRELQDNA
jgi:exonuclease SbcD